MDILVDSRGLPPPEPLERTLAALARAQAGARVRLLIHREPFPLYDLLAAQGWGYSTRQLEDGSYEVSIYKRR